MLIANADIPTQTPGKLISRLCKHWGHKFPVIFDDRSGEIQLSIGLCQLQSTADGLHAHLQAAADNMPMLQKVVADHLQRMAGDETIVVKWYNTN